jgi:hypothetical protein
MSTFSTRRYPLCSSSSLYRLRLSILVVFSIRVEMVSNLPSLLQSAFSTNSSRLISSDSSCSVHRTRGIVPTFQDEYSAAVKGFTHALKEALA